MASMQKMMIIGNLGRDPETRFTPSGSGVCSFSLATSEKWKDKNSGQQQERTEWHNCEAWGRVGEIVQEYCHKGDSIYVEGTIRTEEWEKDGEKKRMTKVRVQNVQMLNTKGGGGGGPRVDNSKPAQQERQPTQTQDDFEDDIPF